MNTHLTAWETAWETLRPLAKGDRSKEVCLLDAIGIAGGQKEYNLDNTQLNKIAEGSENHIQKALEALQQLDSLTGRKGFMSPNNALIKTLSEAKVFYQSKESNTTDLLDEICNKILDTDYFSHNVIKREIRPTLSQLHKGTLKLFPK